jgi:hypothetical protein
MKKLIINALGIGCVITLIAMIVMTVYWKNEEGTSMRNRIDRLSDNIKPQKVVARSDDTYSSSSNLGHVYGTSGSDSSRFYDPTDYSSGDSYSDYDEIQSAEIIE